MPGLPLPGPEPGRGHEICRPTRKAPLFKISQVLSESLPSIRSGSLQGRRVHVLLSRMSRAADNVALFALGSAEGWYSELVYLWTFLACSMSFVLRAALHVRESSPDLTHGILTSLPSLCTVNPEPHCNAAESGRDGGQDGSADVASQPHEHLLSEHGEHRTQDSAEECKRGVCRGGIQCVRVRQVSL